MESSDKSVDAFGSSVGIHSNRALYRKTLTFTGTVASLTVTDSQQMKPVLKQFLIQPEVEDDSSLTDEYTAEELASLGVKTSDSDLEKLKCDECSFQVRIRLSSRHAWRETAAVLCHVTPVSQRF